MVKVGDCLQVMRDMEADSVDAIVTDPPYGLRFMGKDWDHGVPGEAFWTAALRVAKPGTYLLAFGGTRTHHRLACAIEDAGWEIRDCLMWLYGQGFPKGKACLKPAWEPIIMARKPGALRLLQIDECRLGGNGLHPVTQGLSTKIYGDGKGLRIERGRYQVPPGRWPANVCMDEEAAAMLDEQTGALTSGGTPFRRAGMGFGGRAHGNYSVDGNNGDSGGASRFFYVAKASRREREAGCDNITARRVRLPGKQEGYNPSTDEWSGNEIRATRNFHPTVKPVALMRWLCRLVTPPGGIILDPFAGSGSTGVAAAMEGFRFVGIELQPEYAEIARARIAAVPEPLPFAQEEEAHA